ncbi:PREDICTED: uncharacterized protein LOC108547056 [Eufriesea mexicana]|uniref:uncharacterized protein LOC108547056 n=1 Tax=Eufriesea mexicana TaxID=516756 RepID=UPI00083C8F4D|nr:PREDICTED: uncharacterized protein LOC108547056 [Eufriesea mexicana]
MAGSLLIQDDNTWLYDILREQKQIKKEKVVERGGIPSKDGALLITDSHCQQRPLTTVLWHRLSISPRSNSTLATNLTIIRDLPRTQRSSRGRSKIASWTGLATLRPGNRSTRTKDNGTERSPKGTR